MNDLRFGDEVEPVGKYADDKKRRYIFLQWMGGSLSGYARVATIHENGDGFCKDGKWVKDMGLVLECDTYVHKDNIVSKGRVI